MKMKRERNGKRKKKWYFFAARFYCLFIVLISLPVAPWSDEATASGHWKNYTSIDPLSECVLPRQAPGQNRI